MSRVARLTQPVRWQARRRGRRRCGWGAQAVRDSGKWRGGVRRRGSVVAPLPDLPSEVTHIAEAYRAEHLIGGCCTRVRVRNGRRGTLGSVADCRGTRRLGQPRPPRRPRAISCSRQVVRPRCLHRSRSAQVVHHRRRTARPPKSWRRSSTTHSRSGCGCWRKCAAMYSRRPRTEPGAANYSTRLRTWHRLTRFAPEARRRGYSPRCGNRCGRSRSSCGLCILRTSPRLRGNLGCTWDAKPQLDRDLTPSVSDRYLSRQAGGEAEEGHFGRGPRRERPHTTIVAQREVRTHREVPAELPVDERQRVRCVVQSANGCIPAAEPRPHFVPRLTEQQRLTQSVGDAVERRRPIVPERAGLGRTEGQYRRVRADAADPDVGSDAGRIVRHGRRVLRAEQHEQPRRSRLLVRLRQPRFRAVDAGEQVRGVLLLLIQPRQHIDHPTQPQIGRNIGQVNRPGREPRVSSLLPNRDSGPGLECSARRIGPARRKLFCEPTKCDLEPPRRRDGPSGRTPPRSARGAADPMIVTRRAILGSWGWGNREPKRRAVSGVRRTGAAKVFGRHNRAARERVQRTTMV